MPSYKLPNGGITEDQQLYSTLWRELGHVVETLIPHAQLAAFDPNLTFNVPGHEAQLVLPPWFVEELVRSARPINGRKFKLSNVRTIECKVCGRPVHSIGAGRTRVFCADCLVVHTKLRLAAKEEQS